MSSIKYPKQSIYYLKHHKLKAHIQFMKKPFVLLLFSLLLACSSKPETPLRKGNTIRLFQLDINGDIFNGRIDQENNSISFDLYGAEVRSLTPTIEISEGARVSPSSGVTQDFSEDVFYTVTSENQEQRRYRVIVNNTPFSSENAILNFEIEIDGETVQARVDENLKEIAFESGSYDISALAPQIVLSDRATISPASGEVVDFTVPVIYTVTAENGDSVDYTLAINKAFKVDAYTLMGPRYGAQILFTHAKLYINLEFLDLTQEGAQLLLDDGVNSFELPILETEYFENFTIKVYHVVTKIPEYISSSSNYKLVFRSDTQTLASDFLIDVLAENAPKISGVNQSSYREGDTLIVTGEHLTDYIGVPSNGQFFLFNPQSSSIDVELNPEQTEYKLLLEGGFVRSAFFPYDAASRDVIFISPQGRMGDQITITIE